MRHPAPQPAHLPLAVCVLPTSPGGRNRWNEHPAYIHEILAHAGLAYEAVAFDQLGDRLERVGLLVTVGETAAPEFCEALADWIRRGGAWLGLGGLCGLSDELGLEPVPPAFSMTPPDIPGTLGEGYLSPLDPEHPVLAHLRIPLHFFNGLPVLARDSVVLANVLDAHQHATVRPALVEGAVGEGLALFLAADLTGAVVRIQQGLTIAHNGVPAPDGTGGLPNDLLRVHDGVVLDWIFDRQLVEGEPGLSAFLEPVADQWRELLLRAIFYLAAGRGLHLPLCWYYPRGAPALAELSLDTDGNEPEKATGLLDLLHMRDIRATWHTLLPGYPGKLTARIARQGHELAMHYNATDHEGGQWSEAVFREQFTRLTELFAGRPPISNKNHNLRWEGDTAFFEWCDRTGVRLDQTKGPSDVGEAGFLFGTCHPYRPVEVRSGRRFEVFELPTLTQDLEVFAPITLLEPLVTAVVRNHGILHLLFHPEHLAFNADVLAETLAWTRAQGLEWWTAAAIDRWERARRAVRWTPSVCEGGRAAVRWVTPAALGGATLLWLAPEKARIKIDGRVHATTPVRRYGFRFESVVFDAQAGAAYELELIP